MSHQQIEGKGFGKHMVFMKLRDNAHRFMPVFPAQDIPVQTVQKNNAAPFGTTVIGK